MHLAFKSKYSLFILDHNYVINACTQIALLV